LCAEDDKWILFTEQQRAKAEDEHGKRKPIFHFCIYASFLLLPIISLVLLENIPWHPNNSECDPGTAHYVYVPARTEYHSDIKGAVVPVGRYEYRKGKCTCMEEYPRYMFILAGFEFLVFVYFCMSDPITNTPLFTILAACKSSFSPRLVFILVFAISYLTLNVLAFSAMIQSNFSCSNGLVFWGCVLFMIRLVIVIFFIWWPCNRFIAEDTQQVIPL
jgi:hypothetical protein